MKVLFAGTPDFAVPPLQALAKEHDVIGVFTQPDRQSGRGKKITPPAVKIAANDLGLSIFQPETLNDQAQRIADLAPDVMVVVAYGMLLPQQILDIPRLGCINIHASLLPRWRGAAPIHRAIEAGDRSSGVAIMRMELGLDTGPVFQALETPILDTDTTQTLHDKLAELGAQGVCETLRALHKNPALVAQEQDHTKACYAKKLKKEEANIDWSLSALEIDRKIRAFIPFPVAQCRYDDTRLRVWQAKVISSINEDHDKNDGEAQLNAGLAGTIIAEDEQGIHIQCGSGVLRLETLQRDGSRAMPWQQFSNGFNLAIGTQLR